MKLTQISITNYRSIKSIIDCKIEPFFILIGENNTGKSNFLNAINIFLSAGSGGLKVEDFYSTNETIIIKTKFSVVSKYLKKIWRPYMIGDDLIVQKHLWIENDTSSGKSTIKSEYHGYKAEPKEIYLSIKKLIKKYGDRPKWIDIINENNLPDYFKENGKSSKAIYEKAVQRYISENDIEYDSPDLSSTQALGFQSKAIANLPTFYLLEAICDYSSEVDKRSSNSTFRRLMSDLSDRIIKTDPKYKKIEDALKTIDELLNEKTVKDKKEDRMTTLSDIEEKIKEVLVKLMPTVDKIRLKVITDDIKTIFSKGVEISVDDGVETDVLLKGHGLQRCIVFSLLKTLIENERGTLFGQKEENKEYPPIILAIEEPEMYIHPQIGKLFYDVLVEFSKNDQVIYTTHSPRFIDVFEYESIALTSKNSVDGTMVQNCDTSVFNDLPNKKIFKGLTQLNSDVNELFFARNVIVVEGPEDKIAIIETLKKLRIINIRTEEQQITIIVAGGKQSIPFFIRVLNAFKINYAVLHDLDIVENMNPDEEATKRKENQIIQNLATTARIVAFPIKLEDTLNVTRDHFCDQLAALNYFANHENINQNLENIIKELVGKFGITFTNSIQSK